MSAKVRDRIEAALRIARDPRTIKAERDAAVAGAERMIAAHDLNRADFQFPGDAKAKPPPRSRFREDLFEREHSPFFTGTWTKEDLDDVFRRFRDHMGAASASAARQAGADETAYQAREREVREEMDRRRAAQSGDARVRRAVNWLWTLSPPCRVYQGPDAGGSGDPVNAASRRWIIPDESDLEYSDEGLIEVAEARGWDGAEARAGGAEVKRGRFGSLIARAVGFLIDEGVKVETTDSPGWYRVNGTFGSAAYVIDAAKSRGFEA